MIIDQIEDDKSYIEKDQVYMEPKVKSKTTQPKKKQYAFNDSRVHSKIINKACSTNFVIKNIRNVKGTMYNRQFQSKEKFQFYQTHKKDKKNLNCMFPYIQSNAYNQIDNINNDIRNKWLCFKPDFV